MASRSFQLRFEDLPDILPVFPLGGALLLPDGRLPLNIFEPRYLSLVQDSLGQRRLFGMIQPSDPFVDDEDEAEPPSGADLVAPLGRGASPLFAIGCAGRISSFEETEDGRLLITLTGVCRFRVTRETEGLHGYRRVVADWSPFRGDLLPAAPFELDRPRLLNALKSYCRVHQMEFNWKAIERADDHDLITSLCMACPFEPREKQAFLECADPQQRAETLIALMEMAVAADSTGHGTLPQ